MYSTRCMDFTGSNQHLFQGFCLPGTAEPSLWIFLTTQHHFYRDFDGIPIGDHLILIFSPVFTVSLRLQLLCDAKLLTAAESPHSTAA